MSSVFSCALALALICPLATTLVADAAFQSGPARVALVELYTSEGCSSCPPAEKWLGELRGHEGLWREFVPVAFHVNYWDRLGWRDALASKAFTEREYAYSAAWGASSVYTPCFVRNGLEWRPEDRDKKIGGLGLEAGRDAGTLRLTWDAATHGGRVSFEPAVTEKKITGAPFTMSIALLGGDIVNKISRGENAGRALQHEFVALRLETVQLTRGANDEWAGTFTLPPRTEIPSARHAIAAWVTRRGDLTPLQAVGGWLQ